MTGLTIDEIAEELGIAPSAAYIRLNKADIKPICYKALYDPSALEAIRDVPGKGRPRKREADGEECEQAAIPAASSAPLPPEGARVRRRDSPGQSRNR